MSMIETKQTTISPQRGSWSRFGLLAATVLLSTAAQASGVDPLYSNPFGPDWVDDTANGAGNWFIGGAVDANHVLDFYSTPGEDSLNGRTSVTATFNNWAPIDIELHSSGNFSDLAFEFFDIRVIHNLDTSPASGVESMRLTFTSMLDNKPDFKAEKVNGGGDIINTVTNTVTGDTIEVDVSFTGHLFRMGDEVSVKAQEVGQVFSIPGHEGEYGWGNNFANQDWRLRVELNPGSSPVPIPGAIWLLGSALLGLVARGRKRVTT